MGGKATQRKAMAWSLENKVVNPIGHVHFAIASDLVTENKVVNPVGHVHFAIASDLVTVPVLQQYSEASDILKWETAMQVEYDTLLNNHTWELVELSIGYKWVDTIKRKVDGGEDTALAFDQLSVIVQLGREVASTNSVEKRVFCSRVLRNKLQQLLLVYLGLSEPLYSHSELFFKDIQLIFASKNSVFGPHLTEHVTVSFARSGGPGGQNVNKVNTKVDMRFNVAAAHWLSSRVRERILQMEKNRINNDGELVISSTKTRTQKGNVEDALEKLQAIIDAASYVPPPPSEEKKQRIRK
ncbi:hypothetical protein KI387_016559, partial [Taxus chinensis]